MIRLRIHAAAGLVCLALGLFSAGGCAKYQFSIVEPPEVAGVIDDRELVISFEPVEYYVRKYGQHVRLRIENVLGEPVTILGERSYVVDPGGQSHPLRGVTIAPASYIALEFPPPEIIYRTGPSFGFGVGVGTTFSHRRLIGFASDPWNRRDALVIRQPWPEGWYWEWKEGLVRLRLAYEFEDQGVTHDFVFERRRVE